MLCRICRTHTARWNQTVASNRFQCIAPRAGAPLRIAPRCRRRGRRWALTPLGAMWLTPRRWWRWRDFVGPPGGAPRAAMLCVFLRALLPYTARLPAARAGMRMRLAQTTCGVTLRSENSAMAREGRRWAAERAESGATRYERIGDDAPGQIPWISTTGSLCFPIWCVPLSPLEELRQPLGQLHVAASSASLHERSARRNVPQGVYTL